ncbi:MAG: FHA domain-containing protein [Planctomycetaceae bacterium]|nr:FHA domain-containing protein [Planctomycetaceae bacterium]
MSETFAEVVIVAGPQRGRRLLLRKSVIPIGRGDDCLIRINEQYVSRQHAQFVFTTEGWVVEGASDQPTFVNDKRYKKGVRVILDTGDEIGLGAETRLLFVQKGDDVIAAVGAWQEAHPAPAAEPPAPPPIPPEAEEADVTDDLQPQAAAVDDAAAAQGHSKIRKYAVFLGVSMGLFLLIMIAGMLKKNSDGPVDPDAGGPPRAMTDEQIKQALDRKLPRVSASAVTISALLDKARRAWLDRTSRDGELYNCVMNFQQYLACRPTSTFETVEDERLYRTALDELTTKVKDKYRTAYLMGRQGQWRQSQRDFEQLQRIVPDHNSPIWDSVGEHLKYAREQAAKQKNP